MTQDEANEMIAEAVGIAVSGKRNQQVACSLMAWAFRMGARNQTQMEAIQDWNALVGIMWDMDEGSRSTKQ